MFSLEKRFIAQLWEAKSDTCFQLNEKSAQTNQGDAGDGDGHADDLKRGDAPTGGAEPAETVDQQPPVTCPMSTSSTVSPVPSCGESQEVESTTVAPSSPPHHIHRGLPPCAALFSPNPRSWRSTTSSRARKPTANETTDALIGEPNAVPSLPSNAVCTADDMPHATPSPRHSHIAGDIRSSRRT